MAIEDGYYISKSLRGRDLRDAKSVTEAFAAYDEQRVRYCNTHVETARKLGNMFHHVRWPLATIRDLIFDHTPVLQKLMVKDYLDAAEAQMFALGL